MRSKEELRKKAKKVADILYKQYPEAACSLNHNNALQLLISTILAAQCTDERVNIVTKDLFKKYITVEDYANANIEELEQDIKSTGFFRNKAKNIIACSQKLIKEYKGIVPDNMEDLTSLAGVGRKTANVILGDIYKVPGVIVDTHCKRLSKRIGLTDNDDPAKVEHDLMEVLPKEDWTKFSHSLVYHGRAICEARRPKCDICPIALYCNYFIYSSNNTK